MHPLKQVNCKKKKKEKRDQLCNWATFFCHLLHLSFFTQLPVFYMNTVLSYPQGFLASHTIQKWSELSWLSHKVMLGCFVFYWLIWGFQKKILQFKTLTMENTRSLWSVGCIYSPWLLQYSLTFHWRMWTLHSSHFRQPAVSQSWSHV